MNERRHLNLGCGGNIIEGWENHDRDLDLSKPFPLSNDTYDMVLLEHCWEHFESRVAFQILTECRRILKQDGVLRLCVPVLDGLPINERIDMVVGHGHMCGYTQELVRMMLEMAGFRSWVQTSKKLCDGHWKVIGEEKDARETYRVEAMK